jgi:hemoglobin-like flavoprotein
MRICGVRPILHSQFSTLHSEFTGLRSLDKLDRILPSVRAPGQRHVAYGVRESHYDTVGAALLWTLEQGLGETWSAQLSSAWASAYTLLSRTMKEAAAEIEAVAV